MAARRIKVLFIQPGTKIFAGIERVVDAIADGISHRYDEEMDVDVLYTSEHVNFPKGPRHYSVIKQIATTRWTLCMTYRRVIKAARYDLVVVPQIEPMVTLWVSCLGLKQRFAMHLHGNPRREKTNIRSAFLFFLMKNLVLRHLAAVFGTSPKQLSAFKADFNSRAVDAWLPNPVRTFDVPNRAADFEKGSPVTFVNVGRFSIQKGQDLLIGAFSELYKRRQNIRLRLVGYGPTEQELRAQIAALRLADVVSIEFHPDNPQDSLCSSDVFVATSRWEGWSLAICEALRCGLPVISFDCEFGPSDILVDRRLGTLVQQSDPSALVEVMDRYCTTIEVERGYAWFRRENVAQYDLDKVVDVHAQAILQAAL